MKLRSDRTLEVIAIAAIFCSPTKCQMDQYMARGKHPLHVSYQMAHSRMLYMVATLLQDQLIGSQEFQEWVC